MAEYIDRDAIYTAFANACTDVLERSSQIYYVAGYIAGFSYELVIEILDNIPAADVAPVVHGRWIDKGEYSVCTECGGRSGTQYDGVEPIPLMTQFCPNCGAKMDGVEEREK